MTNDTIQRRNQFNRWFLEQVNKIRKEYKQQEDSEGAHMVADELLLHALERLGCSECALLWRQMSLDLRFNYS